MRCFSETWAPVRTASLLAVMLTGVSYSRADDSWQAWFDQEAASDLSEMWSLRAGQSFRYAVEPGRLDGYYLEAGCTWHPQPWLDCGLAYRQHYDQRDDRWLDENRPYADLTLRYRLRQLTLVDRNRVEYRMRDEQSNSARYRNRLTLQSERWAVGFGLKPYVAAEAFVDESLRLRERDRTRLTVGIRTAADRGFLRAITSRVGHAITMDYSLAGQRTKADDEWINAYIAAVKLGVAF